MSGTGLRLSGPNLPAAAQDVELRLGPLSAFGTTVWASAGECGIAFDVPLSELDLVLIKEKAAPQAPNEQLALDEQIALEHWATGISR